MRAREEKEKGRGKDGATRLTPRLAHPSPCRAEFAGQRAAQGARATGCSCAPGNRPTNERWTGRAPFRVPSSLGTRRVRRHRRRRRRGARGVRLYMWWAAFQPNKYDCLHVKRENTCVCMQIRQNNDIIHLQTCLK